MKHVLPNLPYAVTALEPHISAHTMTVHHGRHHAGYVKALNEALDTAPELIQGRPAHWLLLNLHLVPEHSRSLVRNNAGGHLNHSMFWQSMSPGAGVKLNGALGDGIDQAFGSVATFKTSFEDAGRELFGSGWVWLVKSPNGDDSLQILTTTGHDNPLTQGYYPLLVNDVWEHAYYLQYESDRGKYLKNWWSVVNWKEAGRRLARSGCAGELHCKTNGEERVAVSG